MKKECNIDFDIDVRVAKYRTKKYNNFRVTFGSIDIEFVRYNDYSTSKRSAYLKSEIFTEKKGKIKEKKYTKALSRSS